MRASLSGICLLIAATACSATTVATTLDGGQPTTLSPTTAPTTTVAPDPSTSIPPSTVATSTTTTRPQPLAGKTVVIDPGHNGMNWAHQDEISRLVDIGNGTKACNTTGTSTRDGYTEAEFNWDIAQLLGPRLAELGASVILTRPDNEGWGPCIDERAAIGNRNDADAVISIHADGGPEQGRGFHVIRPANIEGLTDDIYAESARLAEDLHDAYLSTQMPLSDYIGEDGYTERDDLGGLNLSDVPAVFLEAGNMRNEVDASLLADPAFQHAAAEAIAAALVRFLSG